MPLLLYHEPIRLELPAPGEWVDMKPALSKGDREKRRAMFMTVLKLKPGQSAPTRDNVDWGEYYQVLRLQTMLLACVAWSFPEPITADTLGALDDESFEAIAAKCTELYPVEKDFGVSEPGKPRSSGNGATSPAREATRRQNSAGSS
ncbi:MAG: hypothetical protein AB7N24_17345 [Dehalococcoidia bacterium]